jgi:hypothetical protein
METTMNLIQASILSVQPVEGCVETRRDTVRRALSAVRRVVHPAARTHPTGCELFASRTVFAHPRADD